MKVMKHLLLLGSSVFVSHAGASVDQIVNLKGYWSGSGQVEYADGNREQVRCRATYFVEGSRLVNNLRCASASYKIDAKAELEVGQAGQMRGRWIENGFAIEGVANGRVTPSGFKVFVDNPNFKADLDVAADRCKQEVSIRPKGASIKAVRLNLGRC